MAFCGAKTRSGQPCQNRAMGNGRCRMHGGKATETHAGNQNARTHGIYSSALAPDEAELWDQIPVGALDDELKVCRLQLRRAMLAQQHAGKGDGLELDQEVLDVPGVGEKAGDAGRNMAQPSFTRRRTRVGYEDIINRLLGRIGDLETKRADLLKKPQEGANVPPPASVTVEVRDASVPEPEVAD